MNDAQAPDPFDLARFVEAQRGSHGQALREIAEGRKRTHWMWFVFPQLQGLGSSPTARRYAISGLQEARAYLAHPVLGPRLLAACKAVLASPVAVPALFGSPDDLKLRSCATLFAAAAPDEALVAQLVRHKLDGRLDPRTLELLGGHPAPGLSLRNDFRAWRSGRIGTTVQP